LFSYNSFLEDIISPKYFPNGFPFAQEAGIHDFCIRRKLLTLEFPNEIQLDSFEGDHGYGTLRIFQSFFEFLRVCVFYGGMGT